ncbi:MAG: single-stranded-DNA-specific exonuclease RecJ [Candidatus Gastranaerophilales bacterium]|nr:single-stranded-DNA-specific exonuclease RecJ [Candidatus Gastranaerophilales bacterium]
MHVNLLAKKDENKSVLQLILEARGISDTEAFLNPEKQPMSDPFIFSDMPHALEIIQNAISNKEKILVWGDFDADGVTSTSILSKTLDALGANYSYFLPDRANLGHGINLAELLTQKSKNNIKVLITVDCGISNAKEIKLIKSMGVKTIITDHHEPPEILPEADCILNPLAKNSLKSSLSISEIEKNSYLSGAGVALKLACALLGDKFSELKKELVLLSCVGTISDIVPLLGENRIIAAKGLKEMNKGLNKGISRLFCLQKLNRKIKSEDVAFILAPRINAAGRLDSPDISLKLLLEDNPLAIDMTIEKLDALNKIRQGLCEKIYEEALLMINNTSDAIVLFNENWHLGIIGIVASRLVEKFHVPVFLITKDDKEILRCSIRGTSGYDISKILKSIEDCFTGFGGHAFAGGFSADLKMIDIETLKMRIVEAVRNMKDDTKIINVIDVDMELNSSDITFKLINEIEQMEPFGAQNKYPVFLFKGAKLISQKQIGKDYNHLSFTVLKDKKEFNCVFWKKKIIAIPEGGDIDFIFRPELNKYNDEVSIKLVAERILNEKANEADSSGVKIFDHRQKTGILPKINEYLAQKKGGVKVWAATARTKELINDYPDIKNNAVNSFLSEQKIIMLFDFPPCIDRLREIIENARPKIVHIMNAPFSKNPDDYITTICGMLKFASNKKNGVIDFEQLAENAGLDEQCTNILLELLEKTGYIKITDENRIIFVSPPKLELIHSNSLYNIYKEEFKKVSDFKEYLQTADVNSIRELCSN